MESYILTIYSNKTLFLKFQLIDHNYNLQNILYQNDNS